MKATLKNQTTSASELTKTVTATYSPAYEGARMVLCTMDRLLRYRHPIMDKGLSVEEQMKDSNMQHLVFSVYENMIIGLIAQGLGSYYEFGTDFWEGHWTTVQEICYNHQMWEHEETFLNIIRKHLGIKEEK
jgi:hypothetical protein